MLKVGHFLSLIIIMSFWTVSACMQASHAVPAQVRLAAQDGSPPTYCLIVPNRTTEKELEALIGSLSARDAVIFRWGIRFPIFQAVILGEMNRELAQYCAESDGGYVDPYPELGRRTKLYKATLAYYSRDISDEELGILGHPANNGRVILNRGADKLYGILKGAVTREKALEIIREGFHPAASDSELCLRSAEMLRSIAKADPSQLAPHASLLLGEWQRVNRIDLSEDKNLGQYRMQLFMVLVCLGDPVIARSLLREYSQAKAEGAPGLDVPAALSSVAEVLFVERSRNLHQVRLNGDELSKIRHNYLEVYLPVIEREAAGERDPDNIHSATTKLRWIRNALGIQRRE